MSNKKEMNSYNDVTQNVQTNSKRNELFDFNDMVERNHELSKHILLSKKAKVIKLESNKSLIIFPVNIHEYGNKYIAVNQEDRSSRYFVDSALSSLLIQDVLHSNLS